MVRLTRRSTPVREPSPGTPADPFPSKISALCYSANDDRLAVAAADRIVYLYNVDTGERIDRFSTKPREKGGPRDYLVRAMQFGPDSQQPKLAVAQSDGIVFVYKWSAPNANVDAWSGKKSVNNRFPESSSSITCLTWPSNRPSELVYGLADGRVRLGHLRSNRSQTLYRGGDGERGGDGVGNAVVSLASNQRDANILLSGHRDGTVYRFTFPRAAGADGGAGVGPSCTRIVRHSCPPYALSFGRSICAAGNDRRVSFYNADDGEEEQVFRYDSDGPPPCKEFTVATFNPAGALVVVGNFDSLYLYKCNPKDGTWEAGAQTVVRNMLSVTALAWRPSGASLAVGSPSGLVDVYDACLRRYVTRNGFEVTHVSHSRIVVQNKEARSTPTVLASEKGREISAVSVHADPATGTGRYVVARTDESLLFCDMDSPGQLVSEIEWDNDNKSKTTFIFDAPHACTVCRAGELSIVEYGRNEILGSVRTEFISAHLLSMRINEVPKKSNDTIAAAHIEDNKHIAYLLDLQTICVHDLVSLASTTVNHDSPIDFVELNSRGSLILFRDAKRVLHLFDIHQQSRSTLLQYCRYAQWVPGSDVVVAQDRSNMCVWYNIRAPDQVTVREIKGEIEGIERTLGKTEVLVDEGTSVSSFELVEELIEFGTAIDDHDLRTCMHILESMELSTQSEAMWKQLHDVALENWKFVIAERCAAAIGNMSRAQYLRRISQLAKASSEAGIDPKDDWQVKGMMLQLKKEFSKAEAIYLSHNKVNEAIEMYEDLQMFPDAIRVAEKRRHPDVEAKKEAYYQWLLDTKQDHKAAAIKESQGEFADAINLYLRAGLPGKASRVLSDNGIVQPRALLESVAAALRESDMFDKAGEVYERMGQRQKAVESFIQGNSYKQAVALARVHFPNQVVSLEEAWGDHSLASNELDLAIDHYMEAHALDKAVEAAMKAKRFDQAEEIANQLDPDASQKYFKQLASHLATEQKYDAAERLFEKAQLEAEIVSMYADAGLWERALSTAKLFLSEEEVIDLCSNQAQQLEKKGRLDDAANLYLSIGDSVAAIEIYKAHGKFNEMVDLVSKHRPDMLEKIRVFAAKQLEVEGDLKSAEAHYEALGDWLSAVNMYRARDEWNEAIRIAKYMGGPEGMKRVSYAYALHLGMESAPQILQKLNLIEYAIDYAVEKNAFKHAFEMAREGNPHRIPDIHYKHACFLESQEIFDEAENEFNQAKKPREAVEMYIHHQSWDEARRVAAEHDPASIANVYLAEARAAEKEGSFKRAEELFVEGGKPEMALQMYQRASHWEDALRVANHHLPHLKNEVRLEVERDNIENGIGKKSDFLGRGRALEEDGRYDQAIDAYLVPMKGTLSNVDDLEEVWLSAVRVAKSHVKNRYMNVVRTVSSRMANLGRHSIAADVLNESGQQDEAVEVALKGDCFQKARECAENRKDLSGRVEEAFGLHMAKEENTDELIEIGHYKAALDILAKRRDWAALFETAKNRRVPASVIAEYVALRARDALGTGVEGILLAVETMSLHGPPDITENVDMYREVVTGVLGMTKEQENEEDGALKTLKGILYAASGMNREAIDASEAHVISTLLFAVHYTLVMHTCRKHGLIDLAAKCAITLLRYAGTTIPTDKAFYTAGQLCRENRHQNLAFMLLNRYVDLVEAIDDGDMSNIDNTDFADATRVALDTTLPIHHYVSDETAQEEVRDWVLTMCMDSSIEKALPSAKEAEGTIYAGLFQFEGPSCIVTGFPIPQRDLMELADGRHANRKDWNALVSRTKECPWTGAESTSKY